VSPPTEPRRIAVIGAGIVGICCARWLQADGHVVTVIDPQLPGQGCSWGLAGVIAVDNVVPLANPHTLRGVPRMLTDPTGPLALRWPYLPRLMPWLLRFLLSARPARVRAGSAALAALCAEAVEGYRPLIEGRPAGDLLRATGWVTAFETQAAFDGYRWELDQRMRHGVRAEVHDGAGIRARVPELAPHVVGGVEYPDAWTCLDPGTFVSRLADDVLAAAGRREEERVVALKSERAGVSVRTADGSEHYDHVVVATGAHTRALARTLGDDFPLDTERGYHVMLPDAGLAPGMPVMSGEYKFVTTAMQGGLRVAGTSELAGLQRPPDPARWRILLEHAPNLFPGLRTGGHTHWMGFRPTLPDSLPVIGRSPRARAVTYAFGHQHVGLTLGGITGRLVADDIAGRTPEVDLHALRPDRFARLRRG